MADHFRTINLQTLTDESLLCALSEIEIHDEEVNLIIQLSFQNWRRALQEGLFHLDDESEPPDFEPDQPVLLTLRLRPAIAKFTADIERTVATLADPNSPLNHTEAWFATEIVQNVEVPPEFGDDSSFLQMGARTRWAEPFTPSEESTGSVMAALEAFLNDESWSFDHPEENVLRFPAGVDNDRSWVVAALANEEAGTCTLLSIPMANVPPANRAEAALWMVQMNYDLPNGCFEMDTDDGEVRYRTTFPAVTQTQVATGIHDNLSTMADHFDTIKLYIEE